MKNIASIISAHNKHILHPKNETHACNCRVKTNCPLQNKCLTPSIIYEAAVTNNVDVERKIYIGASETTFKERYRNHTKDFKHRKYSKSTELSKYVWSLKDQDKIPTISWRAAKIIRSKAKFNYCKLC